MPVVSIKGPSGLNKSSKKELIEGALRTLVETYRMPDGRVYIQEVPPEKMKRSKLMHGAVLGLVLLAGVASGSAQIKKYPPLQDYMMPRDAEIGWPKAQRPRISLIAQPSGC
jgi:phenylpyruvate tautomerase PptA (4-oxalocrotonate tautomerase family)